MSTTLVTCPNCQGRPSSHWPGGPCTICNGTGRTTPLKANPIHDARRRARKEQAHGNTRT